MRHIILALFALACSKTDPLLPRPMFSPTAGPPAGLFQQGLTADNDTKDKEGPVKATALFKQACDQGNTDACGALGGHLLYGRGVAKDEKAALALLTKACDAKYGPSCHYLGDTYERGLGVAKDTAQAQSFYVRGCDLDQWGSCYLAGDGYAKGIGTALDAKKAKPLLSRACEHDVDKACQDIAELEHPQAAYASASSDDSASPAAAAPELTDEQRCEKNPWKLWCDEACIDPDTDPNNCGGCGNVCDSGKCAYKTCQSAE